MFMKNILDLQSLSILPSGAMASIATPTPALSRPEMTQVRADLIEDVSTPAPPNTTPAGSVLDVSADAYRLATQFLAMPSIKLVTFTGLDRHDPVAAVVLDTGLALSRMKMGEVAVVDARLAGGEHNSLFKMGYGPGLLQLLDGEAVLDSVLKPTSVEHLWALPFGSSRGRVTWRPAAADVGVVLKALKDRFRFVLVSAAPLLESPDATLMAVGSDGVILVLDKNRHTTTELTQARDQLRALDTKLAGALLTEGVSGDRKRFRK
jgi:Mrp family chromosome partitioning ATPase